MKKNINMPEGAEYIIKKLTQSRFEAYIVGGCVRDIIMGKAPHDFDITTNALPDEICRVFKKEGCAVIPTGIKHGTLTVLYKKKPYEITTYRLDSDYSDGRHPDAVTFTGSLKDDLKRRDFTMNAMAYNHEAGVVDLFGGQEDIKNRIVRCVGAAEERITEDYLRMLRAYRFAATLSFALDKDIIETVSMNKDKIKQISEERIQVEFNKIILSDNYLIIGEFFDAFIKILLPEAGRGIETAKAVLQNVKNELPLRIAAILYDTNPNQAVEALKRLKYDNATIRDAGDIIKFIKQEIPAEKPAIKTVLSQIGIVSFERLNMLQKAVYMATQGRGVGSRHCGLDPQSHLAGCNQLPFGGEIAGQTRNDGDGVCNHFDKKYDLLQEIINNNEPFKIKMLDITGDDIMRHKNEKPGAYVGQALNKLLEIVINDPFLNEKSKLLEMI